MYYEVFKWSITCAIIANETKSLYGLYFTKHCELPLVEMLEKKVYWRFY